MYQPMLFLWMTDVPSGTRVTECPVEPPITPTGNTTATRADHHCHHHSAFIFSSTPWYRAETLKRSRDSAKRKVWLTDSRPSRVVYTWIAWLLPDPGRQRPTKVRTLGTDRRTQPAAHQRHTAYGQAGFQGAFCSHTDISTPGYHSPRSFRFKGDQWSAEQHAAHVST